MTELLSVVEAWFDTYQRKPKVVLFRSRDGKAQRHTIKSVRAAAHSGAESFRQSVGSIQFFPEGRTTIDRTWRPAVYAAVSLGRPASAFFCANEDLSGSDLLSAMQRGASCLRACAAYGFWFPQRFSATAYYWGISVVPAGRNGGSWDEVKARRLSHWRDNTAIGIGRAEGGVNGLVRVTDSFATRIH